MTEEYLDEDDTVLLATEAKVMKVIIKKLEKHLELYVDQSNIVIFKKGEQRKKKERNPSMKVCQEDKKTGATSRSEKQRKNR